MSKVFFTVSALAMGFVNGMLCAGLLFKHPPHGAALLILSALALGFVSGLFCATLLFERDDDKEEL